MAAVTVEPGLGFSGTTAQPAAVGDSGAADYAYTPVGRFLNVMYDEFTATYIVHVLAWKPAGAIDHVTFIQDAGTPVDQIALTAVTSTTRLTVADAACDGSTTLTSVTGGFTAWMKGWSVLVSGGTLTPGLYRITAVTDTNTVTLDVTPGTGTGSTAVVLLATYQASIDATNSADGPTEIRAIIYPVNGTPRVLQGTTWTNYEMNDGVHSLFLNANSDTTLPVVEKYVDSVSGNDTTGDGTVGTPYATIDKACQDIISTNAGAARAADICGGSILLEEGSYTYSCTGDLTTEPARTTARFCTIAPAPGAAKANVKITGSSGSSAAAGLQAAFVKISGLTIDLTAKTEPYSGLTRSGGGGIWVDDCDVIGPGATVGGQITNSGTYDPNWWTGCTIHDVQRAWLYCTLVQSSTGYDFGEDLMSFCTVSIDVLGYNRLPRVGSHPDAWQYYGTSSLATKKQKISYGVRAIIGDDVEGIDTQGYGPTYMEDCAVVACYVDNRRTDTSRWNFQVSGDHHNWLWKDNTFLGDQNGFRTSEEIPLDCENVYIDNTLFNIGINTPAGVTYADAAPSTLKAIDFVLASNESVVDDFTPPLADYPFSLSCWFKHPASAPAAGEGIVSFGDKDAGTIYADISLEATTGYVHGRDRGLGGIQFTATGTTNLCDGKWHLVTAVFEDLGSTNFRQTVYVDGAQAATATTGSGTVTVAAYERVSIGRLGDNSPSNATECTVEDVAIWSTALTLVNHQTLWNNYTTSGRGVRASALSTGLIKHYPTDQVGGTIVVNGDAGLVELIAPSALTVASGSPTWESGSVGFVALIAATPVVDAKDATTITISWAAATNGIGPYTYDVVCATEPLGADVYGATGQTSPYQITGLSEGTTYYIRITVTDAVSETTDSVELEATTLPAPSEEISGLSGVRRHNLALFRRRG